MPIITTSASHLAVEAMNAWSSAAVAHLQLSSPSLLEALRERLGVLGHFSRATFPQVVHSLPVLYPFSGSDLLTAYALFPHAVCGYQARTNARNKCRHTNSHATAKLSCADSFYSSCASSFAFDHSPRTISSPTSPRATPLASSTPTAPHAPTSRHPPFSVRIIE